MRNFIYKTRKALWPKLIILCYHRIENYTSDPVKITVSKENFLKQINFLKEFAKIISPNQLFESLKNRKNLFFKNDSNCEYINWGLIKNKKLVIRRWKAGDFFYPLGMNSRQKISDFLINNKLDYFSKLRQTVMTADGKIFWVCGKRISNWVKINKNTKEIALLEKIKNNYD